MVGVTVVDVDSMLLVAADLRTMAADRPQLVRMVDQATATTAVRPAGVLADAGCSSEENVRGTQERGIEAFIPPKWVTHREWREMTPPRGQIPKAAAQRQRMTRKLRAKRGRERYDRRKAIVQPTFGHIKPAQGFRRVLSRGQEGAIAVAVRVCGI